MALATQCPHCNTTFRVAQDQLKLRAGLVRCGSCKEIFNGIEHLLPTDAPAQPAPASKVAEPAAKAAPAPARERPPEPAPADESGSAGIPFSILISTPAPVSAALDFAYPEPEPEPEPAPQVEPEASTTEAVEFVDFIDVPRQAKEATVEAGSDIESPPEDPLQRMTLVDFSDTLPSAEPYIGEIDETADAPAPPPDAETPDPLDQAIDELKRKPLRGKKKTKPYARRPEPVVEKAAPQPETDDSAEPDEPEFVKQGRRKQTIGRTMRIAMGIGSFVLLLAALGQASYAFRDQISARVPESKLILLAACTWLNCKIGLPAQIESISIESDALETLNNKKDASELTMLLRNSSTTVQAWPHLELTLNDANSTMLARRVFSPHDYLTVAQDEKKGIGPYTEQTIKLYVEFSGVKPAGYHVGVFYP